MELLNQLVAYFVDYLRLVCFNLIVVAVTVTLFGIENTRFLGVRKMMKLALEECGERPNQARRAGRLRINGAAVGPPGE